VWPEITIRDQHTTSTGHHPQGKEKTRATRSTGTGNRSSPRQRYVDVIERGRQRASKTHGPERALFPSTLASHVGSRTPRLNSDRHSQLAGILSLPIGITTSANKRRFVVYRNCLLFERNGSPRPDFFYKEPQNLPRAPSARISAAGRKGFLPATGGRGS
jgi:hypothetical protein